MSSREELVTRYEPGTGPPVKEYSDVPSVIVTLEVDDERGLYYPESSRSL